MSAHRNVRMAGTVGAGLGPPLRCTECGERAPILSSAVRGGGMFRLCCCCAGLRGKCDARSAVSNRKLSRTFNQFAR